MTQTTKADKQIHAAIKSSKNYLDALKQTEWIAESQGLQVASLPMATHVMSRYPELLKTIRPEILDTTTSVASYSIDGKRVIVGSQGADYIATPEFLEEAFGKRRSNNDWLNKGFKLNYGPLSAAGNVQYLREDAIIVPFEDAKKGHVPEPGTPYAIVAYPDTDNLRIHRGRSMNRDEFRQNDLMLIKFGGPERVEEAVEILYDGRDVMGLNGGYETISNGYYPASGAFMISLGSFNNGVKRRSLSSENMYGRFLAVSDELLNGNAKGSELEVITDREYNRKENASTILLRSVESNASEAEVTYR